jgi:hypothetical protein
MFPFTIGTVVGGLLGLGSSSSEPDSKTTITDKKYFINKTNVDVINKNIVNTMANTIMNTAQKCGANATSTQTIDVRNLEAEGDINIDTNQSNLVTLNFGCVQSGTMRSTIAQDLYTQMFNSLQNSNSTEMLSNLESEAASKLNSGFGSWGSGQATSASDTNIDYRNESETDMNIQNVIQKSIENNFSSEDIKECTSKLAGNQTQYYDDIKSNRGNINLRLNQEMALSSLSNCNQFQETANDITNKITDVLSVAVVNENTTKAETTVKAKTYSDTVAKGPFESIGEGIGSAARGIGEGFGSFFSALLSPYMISSSVCCVICIIFIVILYFLFSSGKGTQIISKLKK